MIRGLLVGVALLLTAAACGSGGGSGSSSTGAALPGASTEPVTKTSSADLATLMNGLKVAGHDGFDRVTFTFEDEVPGYTVEYVDPPIKEDGSGKTVQVAGSDYVQVLMQPASGYNLNSGEGELVYKGPKRISGTDAGTSVIKDVVRTGDFEALLTWTIGLGDKVPFRVTTLKSPPRLVVDFQHTP